MEWADSNVIGSLSLAGAGPDRARRPSDLSATICLEVYASFEFQPMLGSGGQLGRLTTTVQQLLDRSAKDIREWDEVLHKGLGTHSMAALSLPDDGDDVYPCSSISVTVQRRKCKDSDSSSSASRVLGPRCVSRCLVSTRSSLISACR